MSLLVCADESVKKVLKDGSVYPLNIYSSSTKVEPGDIAIFMYPKVK